MSIESEQWQCSTCAKYESDRAKFVRLTQLSKQAVKDYEELKACYEDLKKQQAESSKKFRNENAALQLKVQEQQEVINRLQNASEAVCEEYGNLKTLYDVETKATSQILKKASQWYQENRDLKRKSQFLLEKISTANIVDIMEAVPSEAGCETVPESPTPDAEVEQLRSVVAGLKEDMVTLKKELERSEDCKRCLSRKNERLVIELESERAEHAISRKRLAELDDNMGRLNRGQSPRAVGGHFKDKGYVGFPVLEYRLDQIRWCSLAFKMVNQWAHGVLLN